MDFSISPPAAFIFAGQSNMLGADTADFTPSQLTKPAGVTYYNASYDPPEATFTGQDRSGPEVSFSQAIADKWVGRDIHIVKYSVGGTEINEWQKGGSYYTGIVDAVDGSSMPSGSMWSGFVWFQGEADSKGDALSQGYYSYLWDLITHIRKDYRLMPFYLFLPNPSGPVFTHTERVRQAIRRAGKELDEVYVISADKVPKQSDNVHFTAGGQITLGRRLADSVLKNSP